MMYQRLLGINELKLLSNSQIIYLVFLILTLYDLSTKLNPSMFLIKLLSEKNMNNAQRTWTSCIDLTMWVPYSLFSEWY